MNLDWLVIGGGIHGVHLAARLIGEAGIGSDRLRIVDPGDRLLSRWHACTATTGMTHLRSPGLHHLDLHPRALSRFAGNRRRRKRKCELFAEPNQRPALALFNAHCERVIETFELAALHTRDRVTSCAVDGDVVEVRLASGDRIHARNVLLAIGTSEQPEWPDWAPRTDPRVHHIFDPGFDGWPSSREVVVVVGGGLSAGQTALRLADEGHRVHILSRHPIRARQFDAEPGWMGKFMPAFARERDVDRRRAVISDARRGGSVTPAVKRDLRRAIAADRLQWHEGEVEHVDAEGDRFTLRLSKGEAIDAQRVLLATGFTSHRPGGTMIDDLIESASLPCARCGYPIVDNALRWHPRITVCGPLAELELGPLARNISGARRAGDRLVNAIRDGRGADSRRSA